MSSSYRKLPPLQFTLNPLTVITNRRVHIQNLANLLHVAVLKEDWARAYRAWAILIRCPEVDPLSTWETGYLLLTHIEEIDDNDRPIIVKESDKEVRIKREKFLRRLLTSVHKSRKTEVLHALVLHLIESGQSEEALEALELYLPSHPYTSSSPLHLYAGLLSYYLSLPASSRPLVPPTPSDPHPITRNHPLLSGRNIPATVLQELKRNGIPESLRSVNSPKQGDRQPSSTPSSSSSSQESYTGPSTHNTHASMDRSHLRRSLNYFQRSIDLDIAREKIYRSNPQQVYRGEGSTKRAAGDAKGKGKGVEEEDVEEIEVDMRGLGTMLGEEGKERGSGLVEHYVAKIKAIFSGTNPDQDDDPHSSVHEHSSHHHSSQYDDDEDGQDDESIVPSSSSDEEEDSKAFVVEYDEHGFPQVRRPGRGQSAMQVDVDVDMGDGEDSKDDDDEEEDARSQYSDLSIG